MARHRRGPPDLGRGKENKIGINYKSVVVAVAAAAAAAVEMALEESRCLGPPQQRIVRCLEESQPALCVLQTGAERPVLRLDLRHPSFEHYNILLFTDSAFSS